MYAQFWKLTTAAHIIPCVGSDGILFFDGRWSRERCVSYARQMATTRKHYGFTLQSGPLNRQSDCEIRKIETV